MSSQNNAANGAAKETKAAVKTETSKAAINQNPELSNISVAAPVQVPTIKQRIEKFYSLEKLLERREKIEEAIENLADFYISPSGDSCNVRLQDSKGKTFAISHPIVIGEIVNLSLTKLKAELAKIDADFTFNF